MLKKNCHYPIFPNKTLPSSKEPQYSLTIPKITERESRFLNKIQVRLNISGKKTAPFWPLCFILLVISICIKVCTLYTMWRGIGVAIFRNLGLQNDFWRFFSGSESISILELRNCFWTFYWGVTSGNDIE